MTALSESVRLSTLRYQGGLDSYLQVLDAQRSLFQGQLVLASRAWWSFSTWCSFTGLWAGAGNRGWQCFSLP